LRVSRRKQKDRQDPALGMYTIIYSSILIPLMTITQAFAEGGWGGAIYFLEDKNSSEQTV